MCSYGCLTEEWTIHETVNHQDNFIDPLTCVHTQGVERSCKELAIYIW